MSEHPRFDRKKGFVALPVEILEIEMSPGAFRLLVELCRMANLEGYCWPSLSQLSDRLGRSRASISGYLKELRAENLISTEEQKTSNGYNYRLKYRVTFWSDWRVGLRTPSVRKDERSVQSIERITKDKNQNNINQVKTKTDSKTLCLVSDWAEYYHGAPFPLSKHAIPNDLVARTKLALSTQPASPPVISADISKSLVAFWQTLKVTVAPEMIANQAQILGNKHLNSKELDWVLGVLQKKWPSHWSRCPKAFEFEKLLTSASVQSEYEINRVLKGYLRRWNLAQKHLRVTEQSDQVKIKEMTYA